MSDNKKTVIVVEDERAIREAICVILQISGFRTVSAANGVEALSVLESDEILSRPPSVILSDIAMPEMDGISLYHMIQKHEQLRRVPFVFLTAKANPHEEVAEMIPKFSTSVVEIIQKPATPKFIVETVSRLVQ